MSDIPYSMPAMWPSYPEPPYLYRGGSVLVCIYRANAFAVNRVVPEPLKPAGGNLVYAWINDFNVVGLGHYHEAVISIPVEFQGEAGNYMAYHFLDNVEGIAGGREIWGFPRKQAHFTSLIEADVLTRCVDIRGEEILRISMQMTRTGMAGALSGLEKPMYNLKIIPSVRKSTPPDVKQLTAASFQNIVIHRVIEGKTAINFDIPPRGPRYSLAPQEIVGGFYCVLDFELAHGNVVHDYL
ncbi:MAG: acetoacetate decarboxylase family protein [Syntrophobacteraceae bacterium]